jgi:nucleoside-diphosphate-sugar epimerase
MLTDGREKRDLLHADDCAESIYKVMFNFNHLLEKEGGGGKFI